MNNFEVSEPILNSPFEEPKEFWFIKEGEMAQRKSGRRPSIVYPPSDTDVKWELEGVLAPSRDYSPGYEMVLVNDIRLRVKKWREQGYPGATKISRELMEWWRRDGRKWRLFYAQLEAAETVIFLREARADLRQGLDIPQDHPNESQIAEGIKAFQRYATKMATGTGKTTVMGMLIAWSILNKASDRSNSQYSDVALVMCPTVTIRYRLAELDPNVGEASVYRTRDLVPPHLMPQLLKGKVLVKNWHDFEVKETTSLNNGAKVIRSGVQQTDTETVHISDKSTTARGKRYLSLEDYKKQVSAGLLRVIREETDKQGNLIKAKVESTRYLESDASWLQRVLGRDVGKKENILVFNDEAHHAYRIRPDLKDDLETDLFGEDEEAEEFFQEATIWINGLDRIHKHRGINFCIDLSATPYFLSRVGQDTNKPFPWVVSDFPLTDAIESGLVKIPQFPLRDTSGEERPKYFNLWKWVTGQLTPAEKGASKAAPKPEAILKYANAPIIMLSGEWENLRKQWEKNQDDDRPPVFIIVCKNTKIAKVIYEWIAQDTCPSGIPSLNIASLRNSEKTVNTIRIDSKVVDETDGDNGKSDEMQWLRRTLDTIGKKYWPLDLQGNPIYPPGFEELAKKLKRPLTPPGRDIRCIVSVGMLTEGWDCTTVTHIIGIRPFMSQLLCEQVVGRGLRRSNYSDLDDNGRYPEELAQVLGVPFEVIPYKANPGGTPPPPKIKHHVHAIPEKEYFAISFPRVEGYTQAVSNKIKIDWDQVTPVTLDPAKIPPEVELKAALPSNQGRPSLLGPGRADMLTLEHFRQGHRLQELAFELTKDLVRDLRNRTSKNDLPTHILFPQLLGFVRSYIDNHVKALPPSEKVDLFLSPYYGWAIDNIGKAIKPVDDTGETLEIPRYEQHRGPGSTHEVDYWSSKDVREVTKSHLNYVVADTLRWEQSAAYYIDTHPMVDSFVKNAGLGYSIPYTYNGQPHDYVPDFIIHLKSAPDSQTPYFLILETKGFDEHENEKKAAAQRWVAAVNRDGSYGQWKYIMVRHPGAVKEALDKLA
ncbi:MAG: type III restriction endonuclease subunit R [Candidatus Edwardsbacteria bacterium RIFOXYD12_FULL_50_11]|uniref:Type III restriction endonuclease subunit R n=1 Tax=Candidatus Edwardsbacteria bacterium GWF2_54_11 TaxID=1817851 RepID=A0A1F5RBX9_9BACT|nr:MAG: type III restriction endonuclease subunit R [Candidatus Edwardsbacteria bacterium RifOxyC12_full_54_24]OGF07443.1 MAG: type III restriction endonuclease subunit R [Candidatus Edwardsbacteria bacterium RifOxyA12_full_54_48]OGF09693.1 MAG: type III restriction endonuclease subunit R [Candidatus Edwardsbacteria bacterium GWE2_54_12]OGF11956.1 MAG: type III restriction endonuclease subunit R [Candidatus Edwardsbacteria bacterium GWF2_54_11]OGF18138.1 MAG: type III restriction endonuclease s